MIVQALVLVVDELSRPYRARNGRLHPVSGPTVDDCHRYLFQRNEVERFRPENRLTAPQMAKRLNISRSQIIQWIKNGKIEPVSGPGIDACGQYLFLTEGENVLSYT